MSEIVWHPVGDRVPPERRYVLVQIAGDDERGEAPAVGVGYARWGSSRENGETPYFVVPGARMGFIATHWSDSLGDAWSCPLWRAPQHAGRGKPEMVRAGSKWKEVGR